MEELGFKVVFLGKENWSNTLVDKKGHREIKEGVSAAHWGQGESKLSQVELLKVQKEHLEIVQG